MTQNHNNNWYSIQKQNNKTRSANVFYSLPPLKEDDLEHSHEIALLTNEFVDAAKVYTSITNINIENGRLIISFANGLTFDCGKVQGDKFIPVKTPAGIEYRYEGEADDKLRMLIPLDDILFKFEDLTEEQRDLLSFHFSDFTEDEIKLLQKPTLEVIQLAKEATTEAITATGTINQTNEKIKIDEEARVGNENTRNTNEATRILNENTRISEEEARTLAERQRSTNEDTRDGNETMRISSENSRNLNETERQDKESERVTNEENRKSAEITRDSNEAKRTESETLRLQNENIRKSDEALRKEAEALRIEQEKTRDNNESIRITQENKRQTDTSSALASVNEAIVNVETSITNVNTAIENANSQANRAKAYSDNPPKIQNNFWYVWDELTKSYINTNVNSTGAPGKSPQIINNSWWVYNDESAEYEDTGIIINQEFVLTKEKVEEVLVGNDIISHKHDTVYEPIITKKSAFNKEFGDTEDTVAEGNSDNFIYNFSLPHLNNSIALGSVFGKGSILLSDSEKYTSITGKTIYSFDGSYINFGSRKNETNNVAQLIVTNSSNIDEHIYYRNFFKNPGSTLQGKWGSWKRLAVEGEPQIALKFNENKTLKLSGAITGEVLTDFSNNTVQINTVVNSIDASDIKSGTISIERLPKGAIERLTVVADDAAMLALTNEQVQNGDTVKVTSTNRMYFIIDDTKLNTLEGYEEYTVGSATSVPWSGVTGAPTSFPANGGNADTVGGFNIDRLFSFRGAEAADVATVPGYGYGYSSNGWQCTGPFLTFGIPNSNDNYVSQISTTFSGTDITFRSYDFGAKAWSPWRRLAITGEAQPASDVHPWAKEPNKPAYSFSEILGADNYVTHVAPDTITSKTIVCTVKTGQGYVSRMNLGLVNGSGQFGSGLIGVGLDDAGTNFTYWYFNPYSNRITTTNGHTVAFTSDTVEAANKLGFARAINGTYFDGTADIATEYWGTARNISFVNDVAASFDIDGSQNLAPSIEVQRITGTYSGNGGIQPPSFVPSGKVRFAMMNLTLNSNIAYKDFMLMDTYMGTDVPWVTAFAIEKGPVPRAWVMTGGKGESSWGYSAQIWTSAEFDPNTFRLKVDHVDLGTNNFNDLDGTHNVYAITLTTNATLSTSRSPAGADGAEFTLIAYCQAAVSIVIPTTGNYVSRCGNSVSVQAGKYIEFSFVCSRGKWHIAMLESK